MRSLIATCCLVISTCAGPLFAANFKFLTIVSSYYSTGTSSAWIKANCPDCVNSNNCFRRYGPGLLVTVTDNKVTRTDTLPEDHRMSFPQFSFSDPGKIVYYHFFTSGDNTSSLRVMDLSTGAKRDIVLFNDYPTSQSLPQWPAGDWVYYQKPGNRTNDYWRGYSGEIWRVNVTDTSRREKIVDYTSLDNITGYYGTTLLRWNTTPDARVAVSMVDPYATAPGWHYGTSVHYFPPANGQWWAQGVQISSWAGCNPFLSPSGDYGCHFYGAVHQELYIENGNSHAGTWAGVIKVGTGYMGSLQMDNDIGLWMDGGFEWAAEMEHPKFSVNSDRWITVEGNVFGEQCQYTYGSNAAAVNYTEKIAVKLTNSDIGKGYYQIANKILLSSASGDLFLEGGPTNAYQKMDGSWVTVPVYPSAVSFPQRSSPRLSEVPVPGASCAVYTLKGIFVGMAGAAGIGTLQVGSGMYVVRRSGPRGLGGAQHQMHP